MKKIALCTFLLWFCFSAFCQQRVQGVVLNFADRQPVTFATITYLKKNTGTFTDSLGQFQFRLPRNSKPTDSVVISAVGFENQCFAIKDFSVKKEFLLQVSAGELENVIILSSIPPGNGVEKRISYYRGWNEKGTGGEIGQVFQLPAAKMKLQAVQLKINQNYDTCFVKLHIRTVGKKPVTADSSLKKFVALQNESYPGEELLNEEIIIPATNKYGLLVFDLEDKNIQLNTSKVFIGFEIISCQHSGSDVPSFFFMGSQEGENIFKETKHSDWRPGYMYTIFINLLLK